jgi:hypothetical protein
MRYVQSWDVFGIWDGVMLELCSWHVFGADGGDPVLELRGGQLSERDGLDELLDLSRWHLCIDIGRDVLSKLRCYDVLFGLVVVILHELLVEHVHLLDRLDIVQELRDERRLRDRVHTVDIQRHRSVELDKHPVALPVSVGVLSVLRAFWERRMGLVVSFGRKLLPLD